MPCGPSVWGRRATLSENWLEWIFSYKSHFLASCPSPVFSPSSFLAIQANETNTPPEAACLRQRIILQAALIVVVPFWLYIVLFFLKRSILLALSDTVAFDLLKAPVQGLAPFCRQENGGSEAFKNLTKTFYKKSGTVTNQAQVHLTPEFFWLC